MGRPSHGESMVEFASRDLTGTGHSAARLAPPFDTRVAPNPQSAPILKSRPRILLTVRACASFCRCGAQRTFAMFETVTAFMGLVGACIFLAHAFEGVRSRA
jgi:hypothetical protein